MALFWYERDYVNGYEIVLHLSTSPCDVDPILIKHWVDVS